MNLMIFLWMLAPVAQGNLGETRECSKAVGKLCSTNEGADCLAKKWSQLPGHCQQLGKKALGQFLTLQTDIKRDLRHIQECSKAMDKLCSTDAGADCLEKKWSQLPGHCQQLGNKAKQGLEQSGFSKKMKKCVREMTSEKVCPFNTELAKSAPKKAAQAYQACLEKSMGKLSPGCQKLFRVPQKPAAGP